MIQVVLRLKFSFHTPILSMFTRGLVLELALGPKEKTSSLGWKR
jgi:hypothetical protein